MKIIHQKAATEKAQLWQAIAANKKEIKRLQIENQILENDLEVLERQPLKYFKVKKILDKQVQEAQNWSKQLTENWRKKYNLENLRTKFDQIPL